MKQQFVDYKKRNFFYSNTYDAVGDVQNRPIKVEKDLEPFREYIKKSIENLKTLKNISAECREVKPRTILEPTRQIVRLKQVNSLRIKLPKENYYCFKWNNEEYGYFDTFDGLYFKSDCILERNKHVAFYNDYVIFEHDAILDTSKKCVLYNKDEDMYKCTVSRLDFSNIESYPIESGDAVFESARLDADCIIYQYSGNPDSKVKLFGKNSYIASFEKNSLIDLDKIVSSSNGEIHIYDADAGLLVLDKDSTLSLPASKHKIEYEPLSIEEILSLMSYEDQKRISLKNEMMEYIPLSSEKHKSVVLKNGRLTETDSPNGDGIVFAVKTVGQKQNSSNHTIELELIEDEDTIGEIYSNVSYFFLETVEEVKDENNKIHKIKRKHENLSQIEIVHHKGTPVPKRLSIVPNDRQLKLQLMALESLMYTPNRMHAPILELMQDKKYVKWPTVDYREANIKEWYALTNTKYEGCDSQRDFVKKAIATPDFAILEGPPGSGKTTTILEIIAQMISKGQRVMLAASTNAAIDNILERLTILPEHIRNKILAVRLGNENAISKSVDDYTVFNIEDAGVANEIVSRANLVCGTIIGILKHPEFNLEKAPAIPLYDCLIIDEASKTTFQEYLVPAVYSKKWILSGDIKQLTPYIDKDNIAATLANVSGFDKDAQQTQTILMHLKNEIYDRNTNTRKVRFLIRCKSDIIKYVYSLSKDYSKLNIASLSNKISNTNTVSVKEYLDGSIRSALVWGCDILFCDNDDYDMVKNYLPGDLIPLFIQGDDILSYKSNAHWHKKNIRVGNYPKDLTGIKEDIGNVIKDKPWSSEIAWRLVRIQELFMLSELEGGESKTIDRYKKQIEERIPAEYKNFAEKNINLLREIALPSIIQLLQQGISKDITKNIKLTTLNSGFEEDELNSRRTLVEYQHRMHSDISRFSAKNIYNGTALKNGTVIDRDWKYTKYSSRSVWVNVESRSNNGNFNPKEKSAIVEHVKSFLDFSQKHPRDDGKKWTVACLTYYKRQENLLKSAIKDIVKAGYLSSYYSLDEYNAEIMIYSVDKFQGKEADIVFLSMVKSGDVRLGFMDSPNRLNVAITRAKYQMVIVGNLNYFKKQEDSKLLKKLAMEYTNDTYNKTKC